MLRLMPVMFEIRKIFIKIQSSVSSNWVLYFAISIYATALSIVTILKNNTFLTSGFDLGIFNQSFWTTLFEHRFFYSTGDLSFNPNGSFFGVHFSPILFLLLPFYAIYPSVEILLVMQSVILALGAFPVYWMARDKLGKNAGLVTSIIYLAYPPLIFMNLNDFHLEAFTSTFFLFTVYYLEQEEWLKYLIFMILALSTIEFAPIIGVFVAFYGFRLYLNKKFRNVKTARKCLVLTILVSILTFVLAFKTKEFFNNFTSPLPSPFHHILSNPIQILSVFFADWGAKMLYIITLLGPLAFLPFLALEPLIMAIPWIGFSFISTYPPYYSIYYYYSGFVVPFIFVALVEAIERLGLRQTRKIFSILLLSTAIFGLYLPVAAGTPWNYQLPTTSNRTEFIREILPLIPSNASILTQNDLFPHVSSRVEAYMYIPKGTDTSIDYILVDVASVWYKWQQLDIFGERIPPIAYTQDALRNGTHGVLASADTLILLKKGYAGEPVLFAPHISTCNYNTLATTNSSVIEDPTSASKHVLYFGENNIAGAFQYVSSTDLPPGLYRVTYCIKVNGTLEIAQSDHVLTVNVTTASSKILLAEKQVYNTDVLSADQWFNVSLSFGLRVPTEAMTFSGFVTGNNSVYLDYLTVEQLSPKPISVTESTFNYGRLSLVQETASEDIITIKS